MLSKAIRHKNYTFPPRTRALSKGHILQLSTPGYVKAINPMLVPMARIKAIKPTYVLRAIMCLRKLLNGLHARFWSHRLLHHTYDTT